MPFTVGQTTNPVPGAMLCSRQGQRGDFWHNGIDLCAPVGTPVYAAAAGTVERTVTSCLSNAQIRALSRRERRHLSGGPCGCGTGSTYGNYVLIKHEENFYTLYAHLDAVLVTPGQAVTTTTQIGTVGSTTSLPDDRCLSMVPHLHFEVVKSWPLASEDIAARYDVLGQLAAGGVVVSGDTLKVTNIATAYAEPRLRNAKTFRAKSPASFDPTAGVPSRQPSKWPIYVGFGTLVLVGLLITWGGGRRRITDGLGCGCAGGWGAAT